MGVRQDEGRDAFRNLHAEAAILGGILLKNELMALAAERLVAEHFVGEKHAALYAAMLRLWEQKRPIDIEPLIDALGKRVDMVGGVAGIAALMTGTPKVASIEAYITAVVDRATRRELRMAINASKAAIEDQSVSLSDAADTMSSLVMRHAPGPGIIYPHTYSQNFRTWLDDDEGRELSRVFTGIRSIDMIHVGGLPTGVTVVGGRTSHGKSALLLSIAEYVGVTNQEPVQFVCGEMDERQMSARLVALHGRLDAEALIAGTLEYINRRDLDAAVAEIESRSRITFVPKKLTPPQIRAGALRQKAEYGLSLLIIDYIGIMKATTAMRKEAGFQRNIILGEMMKAYKDIADELAIPVIVAAQLSRGATAKKRPTMEDLKESGNLEEDAHVVWLLNRTPGTTEGELIIPKNRNGRVGTAKLYFEAGCMRYSSGDSALPAAARDVLKNEPGGEDEQL